MMIYVIDVVVDLRSIQFFLKKQKSYIYNEKKYGKNGSMIKK